MYEIYSPKAVKDLYNVPHKFPDFSHEENPCFSAFFPTPIKVLHIANHFALSQHLQLA